MRDEQKKEFTRRITQANPVSMITILYEITLAYLEDAKQAHEQGKQEEFVKALHRGQDCLRELQASLKLKYELAQVLQKLYIYMHRAFAQAIMLFSQEPLKQPESILERLKAAYQELEKTGSWEPVMEHSQQVYAGLTYGRNSLVESMGQQGENRGYLA